MKKRLLMLAAVLLAGIGTLTPAETLAEDTQLSLNGPAAVLMDTASDTILYEQNADAHYDPASLTKLVSVYLALEQIPAGTELTMTDSAFASYDHSSSVLWIKVGESLSVESAAAASLLVSANDTTAMLAEGAAGSVDAMVTAMNTQVSDWGLENTVFTNVFGTHDDSQYTSASDMAVMVSQVVKNDTFATLFGTQRYEMTDTNITAYPVLVQDCELLDSSSGSYDARVTGCKVGSTEAGGYAAAVIAESGDSRYVAVVLGEADAASAYADIRTLLDYGFSSYHTVKVTREEIGTTTVAVQDGNKHTADILFSPASDYDILLPASIDASSLSTTIEVTNEDSTDPEEITADVVFLVDGTEVGREAMLKEVTTLYSGGELTGFKAFQQNLDYFSLGVAGVFLLIGLLHQIHVHLRPPE
jgi:D-alanyl-D-alanine carboxypeptidase